MGMPTCKARLCVHVDAVKVLGTNSVSDGLLGGAPGRHGGEHLRGAIACADDIGRHQSRGVPEPFAPHALVPQLAPRQEHQRDARDGVHCARALLLHTQKAGPLNARFFAVKDMDHATSLTSLVTCTMMQKCPSSYLASKT